MSTRRPAARRCALLALLLALAWPRSGPRAAPSPCPGPLDRQALVTCALARSLDLQQAREGLRALAGRRLAAGTWLPRHPVAAVLLADRRPFAAGAQAPTLNWYLTLSQEIEVAGQRRARLDRADAEAAAQVRRVAVAEQEAAAAALGAFYDLLAAREELDLARSLGDIAAALAALAAGRAREALLSAVDADVARAEAVRLARVRFEAERRHGAAQAVLAALLRLPTPVDLRGDLAQAPERPAADDEALVARALALRGEVAAAEMERRARLAHLRVLRRERIPNLTVSFSAQSDGFNERVLGAGVSLPLLLPAPVGPSGAGELQAAQAEAAQAEVGVEQLRRRVRAEVLRAAAAERAYQAELQLVPAELAARALADLGAIGRALATQRLPLREALLSQRSLIELLQSQVQTRLGLALARVELRRAVGALLDGGQP